MRLGHLDRGTLADLIPAPWRGVLSAAIADKSFASLTTFVDSAYATTTVFPPQDRIFRALELTAPETLKAVILGQDPYHGRGQAQGLAFSVPVGVRPPPSLKNIFTELGTDLGHPRPASGCLETWARRGVLLLNSVLTVQAGQAGAHAGKGWERFTDSIVHALGKAADRPVVFVLWGAYAARKRPLIDDHRHHLIASPHPSPFSARRGFFGSRPFSRTNHLLVADGTPPVDWSLPVQQELEFR